MNKFSHPTKHVKENLSLPDEEIRKEIIFNYQLIEALLVCFYHLLNTHIIDSTAKYVLKRYGDLEKVNSLKSLLKTEFKTVHKLQEKDFAKLARYYKLQWETLE